MKSKWFAFGCLTSVALIIIVILMISSFFGSTGKMLQKPLPEKITSGSWLKIDIMGRIVDYDEFEGSPFAGPFSSKKTSVHSICHKINKASMDSKIKGIILEPKFLTSGYANINEIMAALENFKTKGKEIYAYLELAMDKDYLLSTVADKIYLNPSASAGILLTGVGGEILFYKDFFDKIGVEVKVIHAGQYKGAGENYSRNRLSEPVRENLEELFSDIYGSILSKIATNRRIDFNTIIDLYEKREEIFIKQENALESNLIDKLSHKEDFYNAIGVIPKKIISYSDYKIPVLKKSDSNIAVVYAQGAIMMQSQGFDTVNITDTNLNSILNKIEKDNSIKGVVIRVNSPGGSALISENIHSKIKNLRAVKPVVISMGNVAASGGYYISAESDYIFADPYTVTGSIGVVAMIPNIAGLTDKLGIHKDSISRGKYADAISIYSKLDDSMKKSLKMSIEDTYTEFKERVSEGRGISVSEVEQIAQGQVWSADNAVQNHLIDETGILNNAISKAADLAEVKEFTIKYYPEQKNFFTEFLKNKFSFGIAETFISNEIIEDQTMMNALRLLKSIKNDPQQAILLFELKN
ncbi:MAG: signal peptide peptidase SppA [Candidatus Cloacimonetes bacterium]|nr:signal peptide peptidase SppA [Candidatus Cloacimonadota bacterium]